MKLHFLFIIFFLNTFSLFAKDINIEKKELPYIGKSIQYFEDVDSTYDIDSIRLLKDSEFTQYNRKAFLSFFTNSTYWLQFNLINNTQNSLKRYFVFDAPWIDSINIYIYDKDEKLTKYQLGTLLPFKERSMQINLLNQVHEFSNGKHKVYLQIKTRDPFIIPLSIMSEKGLYEKIIEKNLVEISTYSVVTALLIFNLLIFIITRYSSYFFYCLYLMSYLVMSLGYESYTFKYLYFDYPNFQNWMQSIPITLYLLCSLLFAKYFLELKEKLPKLNKLTNNILKLHILIIIITIVLGYEANIFYANVITPLFSIYIFFLGVYSYIKGNKKALFFILATIFGSTGAFFTMVVANLPLIPYDWYLFKGVDIGMMIDSILFSIALAYRYTSLNLILEKTKNEVLELNENLEKQVEVRTLDLSKEIKNKSILLKELSHRIKNNLQIISALLSMDKEKIETIKDKAILEKNIKRIKSISILYENFLESDDVYEFDLKNYLQQIIFESKKSFSSFDIEFNLKLEKILLDQTYLIPIGLVINELITNSIKYAFENQNGQIDIKAYKEKNHLILVYKDNGIGIDSTKIKKGFGFGLINSLIEFQLNGKVECKNNLGLEYIMSIPNND
ncbi:MAG: 7TM diverse intracellular signaling domain-containing protein [Halarcobacter sp.]